jgi:hypothetical protein
MTRRARRAHAPAFKAKVTLAAIKGEVAGFVVAPVWRQCLLKQLLHEGAVATAGYAAF